MGSPPDNTYVPMCVDPVTLSHLFLVRMVTTLLWGARSRPVADDQAGGLRAKLSKLLVILNGLMWRK